MMRNPEGPEETFGDGVQAEDIQRLIAEENENDPYSTSKQAFEEWEKGQFKNKGDDPISDEEPVRLL